MKKIAIIIVLIVILLLSATVLGNKYLSKPKVSEVKINNLQSEAEIIIAEKKEAPQISENKSNVLPDKVFLEVPFIPQAPFQKWDALHEDACEEASLLTVKHFLDKDKTVSIELAEKEIQDMVKFEEKNGYGISITLDELNQIAKKYLEMNGGRVEKNITIEDIKKELAEGRPVIVGAAGKILPNPNFRNGGPNYHMLVVIGYDQNGFVTNDPGTRLGKGFRYTLNDLYNSIRDWNPENILNGERNYLVFD